MLSSDIQSVLQWWLTIFILGTCFLPLTFSLFKNFFDRGYIFSKALGLAFVSYAIFLAGVLHIIKFSTFSSFLILALLTLVFFIATPDKTNVFGVLRKRWRIFIFEEIIFLAGLFFWAYIHSFSPDIHGLEKYMDFGMLNSILRSEYFPPKDMWFTPLPINYYYFGHLATAVLTKLSRLPSNITFNLMLSTIFTFCLVESFSIGANLYKFTETKIRFPKFILFLSGLFTAVLVTFSGNLHILYSFFKPYQNENPLPLWQLPFLPSTFPNAYWYPNATRFIHNTIHEFPIYSWVVADLHGHVLDIPFVLLTIAVLLSFFISNSQAKPIMQNQKNKKGVGHLKFSALDLIGNWKLEIGNLLLIGFLLAVMYMTNAWDGGIYLLLTGLILLAIYYKKIKTLLLSVVIVIVSFFAFSLPYNFFFKPFASGIGVLCSPNFLTKIGKIGPFLFEPEHCQHSYWWQLLILYGFFYFFVLSFGVFSLRVKKFLKTDIFVFLLILLGTLLIIIPEFIYLKDIYPAHYRANTMFKLVFQSFILLSISCGYIIMRTILSIKYKVSSIKAKLLAICYLLLTICLISLVLIYPYLAINSYYGLDQKNEEGVAKKPIGLDGTLYLKTLYPGDYEAINWLNKNIFGQPVILEAQSDSYTDFARISANTGLPTVLGWTVHEWLWRGTYDIPAPRINEIKTIYETTDLKLAKDLLKKYNVDYVYIGTLEYQKYPNLSLDKFQAIGTLLYQNPTTRIYLVH